MAKEAEKSTEKMETLGGQETDKISDKIVFVEIDHASYKKWGRPAITPRNEIAKIIESAYKGGAKTIVLDILLEDRDCCNPRHDSMLRKVFQEMIDRKSATKVIVAVRIGHDGDIRNNLFEDIMMKSPNFYSALPTLFATVTDRVIRYWTPYETFKENGRDGILWNISFLTAMLINDKTKELKDLEEKIKSDKFHKPHHIKLGNMKTIEITPDRDDIYRNRIRFLLIPKDALPGHPGGNLFQAVCQIDEVPHADFRDKIALQRNLIFKAQYIVDLSGLNTQHVVSLSLSCVVGIVIIGNSSPDAGDMHPTPAGNMAGMFIIGNAVNTISLGIQPSHSSMLVNMLIEALIIIMAAYLFLYFQSLLAQILGSIILISIFGVASYYYFLHTGVFLNFIFAVIGMGFHKTISNVEEIIEKRGINVNEH